MTTSTLNKAIEAQNKITEIKRWMDNPDSHGFIRVFGIPDCISNDPEMEQKVEELRHYIEVLMESRLNQFNKELERL